MKKLLVVVFLSMMCIIPFGVNAEEITSHTTIRGVTMDKALYDKMCDTYSEHFVETMSQEEFNNLSVNIDTAVKKTYSEPTTRGSYFSSGVKSINIVKSGDYVTLFANWMQTPNIRSFDVIAVRFSGCSLNGSIAFKQTYSSSGNLYYVTNGTNQYFNNGAGSSALLQYGSDNEYSLTFRVSGSGTVYGTYQHAVTTVSQSDSLNYAIGAGGYGNVILFGNSIALKYDQMPGVDISV